MEEVKECNLRCEMIPNKKRLKIAIIGRFLVSISCKRKGDVVQPKARKISIRSEY